MDKPSACRKKIFLTRHGHAAYARATGKGFYGKVSTCRSPLHMGEDEDKLFLNYWNMNQTFYLKG